MKRRYWAPLLSVAAAIMILVPTTFAQGEPGTQLYANFSTNRFPGGATTANGTLRFLNSGQIELDVTVTGTDVRDWTVRVYRGLCNNVFEWLVNRDTNGNFRDQSGHLVPRVRTNAGPLRMVLFSGDAARVRRALNKGRTIALMLAGDGSGGLSSGSAYRTCTRFGTTPPTSTTSSSTSAGTNTTNATTRLTTTGLTTTRLTTTGLTTTNLTTGLTTTGLTTTGLTTGVTTTGVTTTAATTTATTTAVATTTTIVTTIGTLVTTIVFP